MATYAVGDIQGCYAEFAALLDEVAFDEHNDALWLLGDLINRGPDSLAVMERVMALGDRVTTVLGNHDLHFLAIWYGGHPVRSTDTFTDLVCSARGPRRLPNGCVGSPSFITTPASVAPWSTPALRRIGPSPMRRPYPMN